MIDTTGYAPRDAKLIRENEGKTPYELLELGLSQAAFKRLTPELDAQRNAPRPKSAEDAAQSGDTVNAEADDTTNTGNDTLTPEVVVTVTKAPAKPKLGKVTPVADNSGKQVMVVGPTGIPKLMAHAPAKRLTRSNPDMYKIIG